MSQEAISAKTQSLSAIFAEVGAELAEGGALPYTEEAFKKTLPEDLSYETVLRVQDHLQAATVGFTDAAGRKGIDSLAKNKDLSSIVATANFGRDVVTVDVQRTATFRNPKTGEQTSKVGAVSTRYIARGSKRSAEYRRVTESLSGYASSIFS